MPKRIQRKGISGWKLPQGAIMVSRPSLFSNWILPGRPVSGDPISMAGVAGLIFYDTIPGIRMTVHPGVPISKADAKRWFKEWLTTDRDPRDFISPWPNEEFYEQWQFLEAVRHRKACILEKIDTLAGHDLACWCKPEDPCHADVLIELANKPLAPS